MKHKTKPWIVLVVLLLSVFWLSGDETAVASADHNLLPSTPANNETDTLNCRYGISSIPSNASPWISPFGAGWHLNFSPYRPGGNPANGAEFVYTLRMKEGQFDPPLSNIDAQLNAHPGSLWLVGSEQEVDFGISGDKTYPQDYAPAYHEAYNYIKQRDPSALVGIGGMSMATPMRLDYLTQAWDEYDNLYGVDMPVDIWNVHIYILAEREWNSTDNGHGQIALGTDPLLGIQSSGGNSNRCVLDDVYCIAEHDSLTVFQEQTVAFRTWMKAHGQQNKPFMISEIAILYQPDKEDEFGDDFPPERVNAFMDDVFNYLETAQDPSLGYPDDNNRLVQQWLWFTLNVVDGTTGRPSNLLVDNWSSYNVGDLNALTGVGHNFRNIVTAENLDVNLKAVDAEGAEVAPGTAELQFDFLNNGNTSITQPFEVTYYSDAGLTQEITSTTIDPVVFGCARPYSTAISLNLVPGTHTIWVKVDGYNEIGESDESNADNVASVTVTISGNAPPPHLTGQALYPDALLTWTEIIFAPSYKLYRDTAPYFTPIAPPYQTPTTNSFPDPNVIANGETFYYVVTAVDSGGTEGSYSNRVGVFHFDINAGMPSLGIPQIAIMRDVDDALITWPSAPGATGYRMYKNNAPYQPVSPPGEPVVDLEYRDDGVITTMPAVYYQVTATNATAESSSSNEVGKFSFGIAPGSN